MAFRRRSVRRRFRRSPYDLQTAIQCRRAISIPPNSTCLSPFIDAFQLVGTTVPQSALPQLTKGVVFGGAHFQLEYALNNATNFTISAASTGIEIFEAVVVLPYAQGAPGVPAYLPALTAVALQGADLADRVLWKRISFLNMISLDSVGVQIDRTEEAQGHGPVVIRSKCSLDERHGIFYVANFTNGFTDGPNVIVEQHGYWKLAVKERQR